MSSSSAACHNINFGPGLVCTEVIYHINTTITTTTLVPLYSDCQSPVLSILTEALPCHPEWTKYSVTSKENDNSQLITLLQ